MNAVSVDIKDWLVGKAVGEFASTNKQKWGIFIGEEPTSPDRVITLYDVGGTQQRAYNHDRAFVRSPFQLRVRGKSYLEARDKIISVFAILHRCGHFSVGKIRYDNVIADSDDPLYLTKDDNQRFIWTHNYTAFRQEQP